MSKEDHKLKNITEFKAVKDLKRKRSSEEDEKDITWEDFVRKYEYCGDAYDSVCPYYFDEGRCFTQRITDKIGTKKISKKHQDDIKLLDELNDKAERAVSNFISMRSQIIEELREEYEHANFHFDDYYY